MMGEVSLALATLLFVGSHFLMSHTFRTRLVRTLGDTPFRALYSIVALVTFGWMILAYMASSAVPLYLAPDWWWPVASLLMLLASILLIGSFVRNPAFPHPGAEKQALKAPRGVFAITRHPMNLAFILWALVHLSVWGSPRNLLFAGGLLILALFGSIDQDRRKARSFGNVWKPWLERTSFMPFGALLRGKVGLRDAIPGWIALVGGLLLWLVVTSFHAPRASLPGWLGLLG